MIQVNRIYLIFNRLVTKKFLVDTSAITIMIRKIKVTDYPRLIEIWESAVLSTHDFLTEEDFLLL